MVRRDLIVGSRNAKVMTEREAFRRWNGTDELLLVPPDGVTGMAKRFAAFTIGAAFAEDQAENGASADCYNGVGRAQVADAALQVELYTGFPTKRATTLALDRNADGAVEHVVASGRCRYTLLMTTKVMQDGRWRDGSAAVEPGGAWQTEVYPSPKIVNDINKIQNIMGRDARLRAATDATRESSLSSPKTFFEELTTDAIRFTVGGIVDAANAPKDCPNLSGTLIFGRDGLAVRMPFFGGSAMTPGIRRDAEHRETVLVFQNGTCRSELHVAREINRDGSWHRSALAPIPEALQPL